MSQKIDPEGTPLFTGIQRTPHGSLLLSEGSSQPGFSHLVFCPSKLQCHSLDARTIVGNCVGNLAKAMNSNMYCESRVGSLLFPGKLQMNLNK